MGKKVVSVLIVACLAPCLVNIMAAAPGYGKTVEMTYSIFFPAAHGHTILATQWAKEIEKRTNGAVKINMFPSATLTPPDQCYDGVVTGISDIGMSAVSFVKGRFPLSEVIDLPLGYHSGMQATKLANAYVEKFKPTEFNDVKIMYMHAHGPGMLHTRKPVEKLEDLKGMKIRCTGTSMRVAAALGATPVAMPQTETYDAMQKGVVEGMLQPMEPLKGWKFAEVIQCTTESYGAAYSILFFVAMNKNKWEALSKDTRETIEAINKEWIVKTGELWDKLDQEGKAHTLSAGNKITPLSREEEARWAAKVQPVLEEYAKAMKKKGLPGEEALRFSLEWLKQNP